MHPRDCPEWEYSQNPSCQPHLNQVIRRLLLALREGRIGLASALDSRQVHSDLFSALTPPVCPYYAGHYRGEDYRCLKYCQVGVQGDSRVGACPASVSAIMNDLERLIRAGVAGLDESARLPASRMPREQMVIYTVALACHVFEVFLRIHPYVNGNGHAGRFLIWCLLGRYGYWPERWTIEPRPGEPGYTQAIVDCRNGNPVPLESLVMGCLA
jgi:fido (protein-threonine AMPylation protein)